MRVIKRDGRQEQVSFDKILRRLQLLASGKHNNGEKFSHQLEIDVTPICQKVIMQIRDGITTKELDEFAASVCASMVMEHPDYAELAGRIIISNHHKNTHSLVDTVKFLYQNKDKKGDPTPILSPLTYKTIIDNHKFFEDLVDYDRDYLVDYFGFKTLERSYLLKTQSGHFQVQERPQHLYIRVSVGIHGNDLVKIKETYELLSMQKLSHASPTLFNAGTNHPQNSSCFLIQLEDSIDGIFGGLQKCAKISKHAGGLGIGVSDIRAKGSKIRGTNGQSDGLIPMLRVFNESARYVNQGGKRKGSFAIYLEPHHADIIAFLDLKKTHGDQSQRALDLFLALWISDLFMKRLDIALKNGNDKSVMWSLFCPDEAPGLTDVYGEEYEKLYLKYESERIYREQVPIVELWGKIMEAQKETGVPYIAYKDCVNYRNAQKNIGIVKSSNLCVAPETMILTDTGYHKIKDLEDKKVNVWNGKEFSETTVMKTGTDQEMVTVKFSNGTTLKCTKYHKFYIQTKMPKPTTDKMYENTKYVNKIEAKDLKVGMKLIKCEFPVIENEEEFKYAYTHGVFCGDGLYETRKPEDHCRNRTQEGTTEFQEEEHKDTCIANIHGVRPMIFLYGEKQELAKYMDLRSSPYNYSKDRSVCKLPLDIAEKFIVPHNYSIKSKLEWLAGYSDTDGTIARNGKNETLQICSTNLDFLNEVKLMLQTLGCNPKVTKNQEEGMRKLPDHNGGEQEYLCKTTYRLLINSNDLYTLINLGFNPHRLKITSRKPQRCADQFIKVESIEESEKSDTYCFKESKRGMGIFNGVITGQCIEIALVNSPQDETISVCNLAAIPLGSFVDETTKTFDYEGLANSTRVAIDNLNKIIDVNFYPVEDCAKSNFRDRPVGLGVIGLYDVFCKLRCSFESEEAAKLNSLIFECMYYHALKTSMELAKKNGPYETFKGSPASKGILQTHMWNEDRARYGHAPTKQSGNWDWETLTADIVKYGLRNSTLMALMPTASSAQIVGQNESFECMTYNVYVRRVLSGDFKLVNKYLQRDLVKMGLWTDEMKNKLIEHRGSVQEIDEIPKELKDLYKTAFEVKQKVMLNLAIDRSPYIDQMQSLNIFVSEPEDSVLSSIQMYAFKNRLKTGQYYLRRESTVKAAQFTVKPTTKKVEKTETVIGATGISPQINETKEVKTVEEEKKEEVQLCRLNDPDCLACQV